MNGLIQKVNIFLHREWPLACIIRNHQNSYKLDQGIMFIIVSGKNRPLLLAKGVDHKDSCMYHKVNLTLWNIIRYWLSVSLSGLLNTRLPKKNSIVNSVNGTLKFGRPVKHYIKCIRYISIHVVYSCCKHGRLGEKQVLLVAQHRRTNQLIFPGPRPPMNVGRCVGIAGCQTIQILVITSWLCHRAMITKNLQISQTKPLVSRQPFCYLR